MKPDDIEEILNKLGAEDVPADAKQIAREMSQDFGETLMKPKRYILSEYIMKSRITKLAAAAVLIIAVLLFINNMDRHSVALADVLAKVEQARAYIYKMNVKVTGPMMPGWPMGQDMTGTVTISKDLGIKTEMEMIDPNTGETTTQENYIIFDEKLMVMLMHEKKQFTRAEINDDLLTRMKKQNNDPGELIRQMLDVKYTELGKSEIDGVEVDGFETSDPGISGGTTGDVKVTLWVDSKSWLPYLAEMDMSINEQTRSRSTFYDYQWDVPVEKSDFVPVIPDDYEAGPGEGMKWPEMTEEAAIEGLKLVADLLGRYPKQVSIVDLMAEISPIMFERIKKDLPGEMTETELETKMMEAILPVYPIGLFYMALVEDKKEPVYYGQTVSPNDVEAVLMRWRAENGNYRVIFGDLTVEDVTPDELAELEAAPLNIKPTAIKPQPADGTVGTEVEGLKLSWMPGANVNEHKVYFGTSADQMTLLAEVTDSCSVMAPALERDTTYYWRVDEVQPDGSVAAGNVWNFNTGGLVGWWKLDEGSGNIAADSGDKGLDGSLVGDTSWVDGIIEGALAFDGDGDYVDLGKDAGFDITRQITISTWIKVNAFDKKFQSIITKGDSAWRLHRHRGKNALQFTCSGLVVPDNRWGNISGTADVNDGQWHHAVGTYDGSQICLYVDGRLDVSSTASGTININDQPVYIGENSERPSRFWNGLIDDVRLYSYALTADEVAAIYADRKVEN